MGPGKPLRNLAAVAALFAILTAPAIIPPVHADLGDCSQPVTTGAGPLATDCLLILQVAVSIASCNPDPCICAPSGQLPVAATDALVCLQVATAQGGTLNCPCSEDCEDGLSPTCGGACPAGDVCAVDPFDPVSCTCLNDCEQGPAPQCGGTGCDGGELCQSVGLSVGGGSSNPVCVCLPPGVVTCESSPSPQCFGVCAAGSVCSDEGGACSCSAQPIQGPCASALAPACGGTCPVGFICEPGIDGCGCVDFTGQSQSCSAEDAPTCGGVCASGSFCAVGIGEQECDCFLPCEISTAPMCSGSCLVPGQSCTTFAATVNGGTLLLCGCVFDP